VKHDNEEFYDWLATWYEEIYEALDTEETVRLWMDLLGHAAPWVIPADDYRPRLLDAGCGPGWHAVAWARAGFSVSGMDVSSRMLARAALRVKAGDAAVELIKGDLRTWRTNSKFNLIVSHTNFLHLFGPEDLLKIASTIKAASFRDTVWLQDFANLSTFAREGTQEFLHGPLAGLTIEGRHVRPQGRYEQQWSFGGRCKREVFWAHTLDSVQKILAEAGWCRTEAWSRTRETPGCWKRRRALRTRGVLIAFNDH
jgi:SAM-dependent methyltransferase